MLLMVTASGLQESKCRWMEGRIELVLIIWRRALEDGGLRCYRTGSCGSGRSLIEEAGVEGDFLPP